MSETDPAVGPTAAPAALAPAPSGAAAGPLAARPVPTSIRFSVIFAASVVGCLAAALVLNLLGNGTKLFPSPGFPAATCIRAWKARRAARLARAPEPPRVLVLGSSRVIPLQEADVRAATGLPAFNFGVSVGCPVDYLAHLRFALETGMRPQMIILGVDELAFGDNPEADIYDMQLITHPGVFRELPLRDRIPIVLGILKTISMTSTKDSAQNLWRRWRRHGPYVAPDDETAAGELEGAHPPAWDTMPEDERRARLAAGIDEQVRFWGKYLDRADKVEGMRPTSVRRQRFEELLDLATEHHIDVRVVQLPVHSEFERRTFSPRLREIRAELGKTLAESCRRHGFVFRDYTDLTSFDGRPEDFEDGTHMTPANGRRILAALFPPADAPTPNATATVVGRKSR